MLATVLADTARTSVEPRGARHSTMVAMHGADTEALRGLAHRFDAASERLDALSVSVKRGLEASAWVGPVSARFRVTWDTQHSRRLGDAALRLRESAVLLRTEALQQDHVSSAATATQTVTDAPPPSGDGGRLDELSVQDCVDLMQASYDADSAPAGWEVLSSDELVDLGLSAAEMETLLGLNAVLLTNGKDEYVLSFAGSETGSDWLENGSSLIKSVSFQPMSDNQALEAMDLAMKVSSIVGKEDLLLVGHSLGGREAAAASLATGVRAVTFNAAGVTAHDIAYASWLNGEGRSTPRVLFDSLPIPGVEQQTWGLDDSKITNYFSTGDVLTWSQRLTEASDAIGRQVPVDGADGIRAVDSTARCPRSLARLPPEPIRSGRRLAADRIRRAATRGRHCSPSPRQKVLNTCESATPMGMSPFLCSTGLRGGSRRYPERRWRHASRRHLQWRTQKKSTSRSDRPCSRPPLGLCE